MVLADSCQLMIMGLSLSLCLINGHEWLIDSLIVNMNKWLGASMGYWEPGSIQTLQILLCSLLLARFFLAQILFTSCSCFGPPKPILSSKVFANIRCKQFHHWLLTRFVLDKCSILSFQTNCCWTIGQDSCLQWLPWCCRITWHVCRPFQEPTAIGIECIESHCHYMLLRLSGGANWFSELVDN